MSKADDYAFGVTLGLGMLVGGLVSYYWGKPLSVAAAGGITSLLYAIRLARLPRPGAGEGER